MCLRKDFLLKKVYTGKRCFVGISVGITDAGLVVINKNEKILETPSPKICALLDRKE